MLAGTPYVRARASYYDIHTEFHVPRMEELGREQPLNRGFDFRKSGLSRCPKRGGAAG